MLEEDSVSRVKAFHCGKESRRRKKCRGNIVKLIDLKKGRKMGKGRGIQQVGENRYSLYFTFINYKRV